MYVGVTYFNCDLRSPNLVIVAIWFRCVVTLRAPSLSLHFACMAFFYITRTVPRQIALGTSINLNVLASGKPGAARVVTVHPTMVVDGATSDNITLRGTMIRRRAPQAEGLTTPRVLKTASPGLRLLAFESSNHRTDLSLYPASTVTSLLHDFLLVGTRFSTAVGPGRRSRFHSKDRPLLHVSLVQPPECARAHIADMMSKSAFPCGLA